MEKLRVYSVKYRISVKWYCSQFTVHLWPRSKGEKGEMTQMPKPYQYVLFSVQAQSVKGFSCLQLPTVARNDLREMFFGSRKFA